MVAFDPIEIQTQLALQNDRQHINFVKDMYVFGEKMARNGLKMAKLKGCLFYIEKEYRSLWIRQVNLFYPLKSRLRTNDSC